MLAWYESQLVPEVGRRLVAEIFDRANGLSENPDIGRIVPEFGQMYLRELIHPPYRIVYKREKRKIRIVRAWRSERLLGSHICPHLFAATAPKGERVAQPRSLEHPT